MANPINSQSICKISSDGTKEWFLNDQRHRTDGPAIEYPDGTKEWFLNGQLHRTDGPAIECPDGTKYWYLNGQYFSKGPSKTGKALKLKVSDLFTYNKQLHLVIGKIDLAVQLKNLQSEEHETILIFA